MITKPFSHLWQKLTGTIGYDDIYPPNFNSKIHIALFQGKEYLTFACELDRQRTYAFWQTICLLAFLVYWFENHQEIITILIAWILYQVLKELQRHHKLVAFRAYQKLEHEVHLLKHVK